MTTRLFRIGTRKSVLAQTQSEWVVQELRRALPSLAVEIVFIVTSGDRRSQDGVEPAQGGLKALFTKELDEALLDRRIDLSVHSLKDLAGELPPGISLGAIPKREDARDAWISKKGIALARLPKGARIATGAVRRQAQLLHWRPDLTVLPLRGNVDTRLRKMLEEEWDGLLLAAAGLRRLGLGDRITECVPTDLILPAVGQGCLAVECRDDDAEAKALLERMDHGASRQAATAERALLKTLGGSCQTPIAAYASIQEGTLTLTGAVASLDGKKLVRQERSGAAAEAEALGHALGQALLSAGAAALLHS